MPLPRSAEAYLRQHAEPITASVDQEPPMSPVTDAGSPVSRASRAPSDASPEAELRSIVSGSSRRTAKSSIWNNVSFKDCKWDFFLCCTPPGRNALLQLHEALPERFEGSRLWLDEQHDSSDATLVDAICNSRNVLVFLTAGSTSDAKWQHQMRVAMGARRNFILLGETDEMHGKPSIDELIAKCPADLKPLFNDNVIIPYFSDEDFRNVTFDKMSRVMALDPDAESMCTSRNLTKARTDLFYKNVILIDEETEVESVLAVFPPHFTRFSAFCGMPLPGASANMVLWSRFVKVFIVVCMLLCTTRFFTPEGPGFLDYFSVAQIVALHPVLLLMMFVMMRAIRGPIIQKLLLTEIETSVQAKWLSVKIERLTYLAVILTAALSIWGWIAYLPGFWTTYYLEASNEAYTVLGVVGMIHGAAWLVALPVVFGIVFAVLILGLVLQELGYMGLLSAFNELHPEIATKGFEVITASPAGMSVKDGDLYRFQVRYLRCWEFYSGIQWSASLPFLAFWMAQVLLLCWSIWSLAQGFDAVVDDRTLRLREHWHLSARLTWLVGASPWFGLAGYIIGLWPWGSNFYASKLLRASNRIFFTNSNLRICFMSFMYEFDLEFRVLFLQATPMTFFVALTILGVNSMGYMADVVRLFSGV